MSVTFSGKIEFHASQITLDLGSTLGSRAQVKGTLHTLTDAHARSQHNPEVVVLLNLTPDRMEAIFALLEQDCGDYFQREEDEKERFQMLSQSQTNRLDCEDILAALVREFEAGPVNIAGKEPTDADRTRWNATVARGMQHFRQAWLSGV